MLRFLSFCFVLGLAGFAEAREPTAREQQQAQDKAAATVQEATRQAGSGSVTDALRQGREAMRKATPAPSPGLDLPGLDMPGIPLPGAADLPRTWAIAEGAEPSPLLVLVSFSMPEASLKALAEQAAKLGAPLVLRGLVADSMEETAKRIAALLKDVGTSLAIDPTLFSRFGVDRVPTLILPLEALRSCTPQDCPVPAHVKLTGEASLGYQLEQIERRATQPAARERASTLRRRLEQP